MYTLQFKDGRYLLDEEGVEKLQISEFQLSDTHIAVYFANKTSEDKLSADNVAFYEIKNVLALRRI